MRLGTGEKHVANTNMCRNKDPCCRVVDINYRPTHFCYNYLFLLSLEMQLLAMNAEPFLIGQVHRRLYMSLHNAIA